MFIVSFKTSRKKLLICACALLVLITVIIVLCSKGGHKATATMSTGGQYSLKAETNEDRIAFFKQFGWEVAEKPIEISDVTIPETFNTVYENYNKMQLEQGLDLSKYKGKICKQWVYEITNYPSQTATVRGTLLVMDDVVIGGDISSASLNGFICGFAGQKDVNDPDLEGSPSEEENAASGAPKAASSAVGANKTTSSQKKVVSSAAASKKPTSSASKSSKPAASKSTKSTIPTAAWPTD